MGRVGLDALMAYEDGEATAEQATELESRLARDVDTRVKLAALQSFRAHATRAFSVRPDPSAARRITEAVAQAAAPRRRAGLGAIWAAAAAGCAMMVWVVWPQPSVDPYQARGGTVAEGDRLGLEVYLHRGGHQGEPAPMRDGDRLGPEDGLSFVGYNRTAGPVRLLILAVDASGDVAQIFPIERARGAVELPARPTPIVFPEGVQLDAPPGRLELFAVFSSAPLSASVVEASARSGDERALARLGAMKVVRRRLRVVGRPADQ